MPVTTELTASLNDFEAKAEAAQLAANTEVEKDAASAAALKDAADAGSARAAAIQASNDALKVVEAILEKQATDAQNGTLVVPVPPVDTTAG